MVAAAEAAKVLALRVVTPEQVLVDARVSSLRLPGADGFLGVLPRHAPMVALTESGLLTARTPEGRVLEYLIHDGFAEVRRNAVTVLTRAAEKPHEIDLERARQAAERARARLRSRTNDVDMVRALAALRRALARERHYRSP